MTELSPLPDSPDSRNATRHLYDNAPGYFRAVYGREWSEAEIINKGTASFGLTIE
ncbi:hypothetical protein KSF73_01005 [Burkholderiaceae bacterium DAT-1]|nr:hypothetical protein [Burkholderiaceae bacterium DAT-1]